MFTFIMHALNDRPLHILHFNRLELPVVKLFTISRHYCLYYYLSSM